MPADKTRAEIAEVIFNIILRMDFLLILRRSIYLLLTVSASFYNQGQPLCQTTSAWLYLQEST